jgi:hypothetical protein
MTDRPVFRRGPRERPQPFSKALRNESPQKKGRRREKELAADLGGSVQPGSGCFDGKGGDVVKGEYLIEHKYTTCQSYSLSLHVLRKIRQEAEQQRKKPVLVVEMSGGYYGLYPAEKWACLPYEEWKRLLEER